mgnify:FL=1
MDIQNFKHEELTRHLADYLEECDSEKIAWYLEGDRENQCELHDDAFNNDYYIIGTWKATQWLGESAFEVINHIKEYEQDNFGEVNTDLSSPESIVNMFAYIAGESVVSEWYEEDHSESLQEATS